MRLYVALREAAHQRLFGHVPWLRGHVLSAVETYAARHPGQPGGDRGGDGPGRPDRPGVDAGDRAGGHLHPGGHPAAEGRPGPAGDRARPGRGLGRATWWTAPPATGCPTWSALGEAFRRRRAAGGPAEQTFAALVGLELRPRRLREAAALWAALTEHRGIAGRDALWGHPDLLPADDDFADPEAFARRPTGPRRAGDFDFTAPGDLEEQAPHGETDAADDESDAATRSTPAGDGPRHPQPRRWPDRAAGRARGRRSQPAGEQGAGGLPALEAGSSVARSAGPRSRRQPAVTATSPGAGRGARSAAGAAVSRSSAGSQSGAGSRAATPSSPAAAARPARPRPAGW